MPTILAMVGIFFINRLRDQSLSIHWINSRI